MRKVEADTLEEAYQEAAIQLACSVNDIEYEVIQYPSSGMMGLFKKRAIIVAVAKKELIEKSPIEKPSVQETSTPKIDTESISTKSETIEESVASEILAVVKEEVKVKPKKVISSVESEKDDVVDNFFAADKEKVSKTEVKAKSVESRVDSDELALSIENDIKKLMEISCFDIDTVEVDVRDNIALIFIDGEDAALLIGKEGYRYNAISYMLFNWLYSKHGLFIKLEIAEFLTSQQEMIRNYIRPVVETIEKFGKGKTRTLDGILVQIALEQLREIFPNKYVAVKTGREGNKYIIVNEFNSSKSYV